MRGDCLPNPLPIVRLQREPRGKSRRTCQLVICRSFILPRERTTRAKAGRHLARRKWLSTGKQPDDRLSTAASCIRRRHKAVMSRARAPSCRRLPRKVMWPQTEILLSSDRREVDTRRFGDSKSASIRRRPTLRHSGNVFLTRARLHHRQRPTADDRVHTQSVCRLSAAELRCDAAGFFDTFSPAFDRSASRRHRRVRLMYDTDLVSIVWLDAHMSIDRDAYFDEWTTDDIGCCQPRAIGCNSVGGWGGGSGRSVISTRISFIARPTNSRVIQPKKNFDRVSHKMMRDIFKMAK